MKPVQLAIIALATASTLPAQASSATSKRVWVSAGLGYGASPPRTISYLASAWYSTGALAVGLRAGGVGGLFGEFRGDRAALLGATVGGARDFVLAGVGIGRVSGGRTTSDSRHIYPAAPTFVYTLEAHPRSALGLGVTMFGAVGAATARYTAFAITVNARWFGN